MTEVGEDSSEKDMGYKFGQMEPDMKVIGTTTKLMEKESLYTSMAMFMMAIG